MSVAKEPSINLNLGDKIVLFSENSPIIRDDPSEPERPVKRLAFLAYSRQDAPRIGLETTQIGQLRSDYAVMLARRRLRNPLIFEHARFRCFFALRPKNEHINRPVSAAISNWRP
jgi:hypothetical protein